MYTPPYPYQFPYGGANINQPPSISPIRQYSSVSPQETNYIPPYADSIPSNSPANYGSSPNNQFFPGPRPLEKYDSNSVIHPEGIGGNNPGQPSAYLAPNSYIEDYTTKTLQQIKEEVAGMQQYLGTLKTPGYSKSYEDQELVPKLEGQINDLQSKYSN